MGKKVALVLLGTALSLFAEFNRSSLLIDMPTAYVLRHKVIQGTAVGNFGLGVTDPRSPYDLDVTVGAGIGDFLELSLTAYSLENYALGASAMVLREGKYYPSVAVGIHDITWVPYIGSFGGSDTSDNDPEDRMISGKPGFAYWEQQEWFSAFAVASKQIGEYFRIHMGLGRGRYTGYYGFERYLNTDIFSDSSVSNFAFGLFGALEFNYQEWLSIAAEYDGRDLNLGTKVGFNNWEVYLGMTRLENLIYNTGYYPRLVAGLNFYTSPHSTSKGSAVSGKAVYADGKSASGATVEIIGDDFDQTVTCTENGTYRFRSIPQGTYKIVAYVEGFRSKPLVFKVGSAHENIKSDLVLEDISSKGTIQGKVLDSEDGSGVIANVSVIETGDIVRAGPRGGEYRIVGLEPGKYTLMAEAKGYFDRQITCQAAAAGTTNLDLVISKSWIIFHFKPGEKLIEPRYVPVLEDVVKFLKERPSMVVEIQGHTDSVGDAKNNRDLSRNRAEAVRDYLIKRGISEKRLVVKGYGELSPIGDNRTVIGRDMNRRVELVVISE